MFEFVKRIQESSTIQDLIMILFDILKVLFTNISVDFMIDVILNKIYENNLRKIF